MPRDHVETVTDTVAVAPIRYTGQALLQQDIDNFKAALRKVKVVEGFLPVAAPASVIPDRKNEYYKSEEDLAEAIGQAMNVEYKQIVDNGLLVQLDDARAAVTYDRMVPPASFQDYRKRVRLYQDVLNRATDGHPDRENPLSRLLGQLARPAHHRRADQGHRRPDPARARRRLCAGDGQSAPRARMAGVAGRQAAEGRRC